MRETALKILCCPFCGSTLSLHRGKSLELRGEEIVNGIISCQCSAYPIVAGIPCFTGDYTAEKARQHLLNGEHQEAFFALLDLEKSRQADFSSFIGRKGGVSFSEGIRIFCSDSESDYFVHRFSDPTFLACESLVRAIGSNPRCFEKRTIDLCGGLGHLTRVICQMAHGAECWLTDIDYWKLWWAKHITAPECQPVCCDANIPLPFARDAFSLAVCSDAFHYIWSKRLFADEIMRIADESGVIVLPHIHNALVKNHSAGIPLSPKWLRNLFAGLNPRLFKESEIFESALATSVIDLTSGYKDEELQNEAVLFLIATKLDGVFRVYERMHARVSGKLCVNPLYKVKHDGADAILDLQFPSPKYEEEFGACKRYLPDQMRLDSGLLNDLSATELNPELQRLIANRVLLDLPIGYL